MPRERFLEHLAFNPLTSKGRRNDSSKVDSGIFEEDIWRMIFSPLLARLGFVTQVYPTQPLHFDQDVRFTHTVVVAQVAQTLAQKSGLCIDLARAVTYAHDIGHPPFAHEGEKVIDRFIKERYGDQPSFTHEVFGVHLAQDISSMDLTYEVLQGVLYHGFGSGVMEQRDLPEEYRVVALADKAYVFCDTRDTLELLLDTEHRELLLKVDHPQVFDWLFDELSSRVQQFGEHYTDWGWNYSEAILDESRSQGTISFQHSSKARAFKALRDFLFREVYSRVNWDRYIAIAEEFLKAIAASRWFQKNNLNPAVVFALTTEREIFDRQAELAKGDRSWDFEYTLDLLELNYPLDRLPTRDDLTFLSPPDLGWATNH